MAIYKVEKCPCGYNRVESQPTTPGLCPTCGKRGLRRRMAYSENYHISYTHHGKKYVESVAPQKREAETRLGKIKADIRERRRFDMVPATPWNKAVEQFRQWFEVNVTSNTKRMYENGLKNLSPYFEGYTLDKITPPMLEQFKAMRSIKVKPATVNRDLSTMKRLFSLSEEWGLLEINRIRKVKLLKENNARTRFLTDEEAETLLRVCREGFKGDDWTMRPNPLLCLAVQIGLNTGMRKDNVLTLRWDEIDWQNGMIRKRGAKGGKTVHIPLTDTLRAALLEHKRVSKVLSPYILPSSSKRGAPSRDLKKAFSTALKGARIDDFRFHDLRHTFASHFLMRTGDLKALQELLGHSSIQMTMRYAHLLDEHKKKAMAVFEKGALPFRQNESR